MPALKALWFLFAFSLPLVAQEHWLNEHQLGAYKGNEDAVSSVMNSCDAVDDSMQQQQPRVFAELKVDRTAKSKSYRWREIANKDEWEAAGKPIPLAFVWNRDGAILRVAIVAED